METVRIPNSATYSPLALTDVAFAAPLASRLLLGATLPGRMLQAAALGAYAASVVSDWAQRHGVRPIVFEETYGAGVRKLDAMTVEQRWEDAQRWSRPLAQLFRPCDRELAVLAEDVNERLTSCIAGVTGQRVETSSAVRRMTLSGFLMPFALGSCDILSGDVAIFRNTGVFMPHILAHEFSHRKGYFKELEAQALAYLALSESQDPVLRQAALAERVYRNLRVMDGGDHQTYLDLVERLDFPDGLKRDFVALGPGDGGASWVTDRMRDLYDLRMKATGQNGLSDYDEGFTNFLFTIEKVSS